MSVYDPSTFQTVLAKATGGLEKIHGIEKVLVDLAENGLITLEIGPSEPVDTTKIWLDTALGAPGIAKGWTGAAWTAIASQAALLKHMWNNARNQFAATSAPTTTDDNTLGYGVGSMWWDTVGGGVYSCVSAATGAANWAHLNAPGGAGTGAAGKTVIDFGTGDSIATKVITGQASILAGSIVQAWLLPMATIDHSIDEHLIEEMDVFAGDIVAGTGFTIWARTRTGPLTGVWTVGWRWS